MIIVNIYNNYMFNLKSKITEKLFGYYFLNSAARHYLNELAKILEVDPGNLDRKLKELEKEGIFFSKKEGNLRYYFLNKNYQLLSELKKLYNIKYGLEKKLASRLKGIKGLEEAYIFGSYAKDKFAAESDIDILLIGGHSSLEAVKIISEMEKEYRREFNIVDMAREEFKKRKKNRDEFIKNIFAGKIIKII